MSDPSAQAQDLAANCPLANCGTGWGKVPLWAADLIAALNWTVDFYAKDETAARAALPQLVQDELDRRANGGA